jgi:hypothetical protein
MKIYLESQRIDRTDRIDSNVTAYVCAILYAPEQREVVFGHV